MKVAIVGGHLAPALSVVDVLGKNVKLLYIGRKHTFEADKSFSLEYKTITDLGIAFSSLTTGRLQRKFTRHTIQSLLKLPIGFGQSVAILKKFKPDVVLGFGGYLQIPVVLASFFLRIPVVLHEQTMEAGLANKICSSFAARICISWESSADFFPKEKTTLTGNPVRKDIIRESQIVNHKSQTNEVLPLIYVTGGSSGSHFINTLIEGCVGKLLENFRIIHQTGDAKDHNDFNRFLSFRKKLPSKIQERYTVEKFISPSKVGKILRDATLVIGRSGINTVTELMFTGKPCILVPLPFSQNNEQFKNALFLKKIGLAEVISQNSATSDMLLILANSMIGNIEKYIKNADKARRLVDLNATNKIIKVLEHEAKNH
ncbi:MAG: UDP-N-acetylglucosamine--N-acetylmuramyl-(pentapeptide) pyrophosphoryl-undecaprenol N-acetylglucosamine transferase [Patescibacteria group bacterium]|nr:UDP-N-acetylglucosamine--N-acetylmuramyl-(pentapeptide) pyrophosphoryl-undecaprenol N-acetylglucosamine transferase [Patescibacteria group bacterium]